MKIIQIAMSVIVTTGFAWTSAQAAPTIWRCGNSYSEQPCAGGTTIRPDPAPSAEQRRQADEATRQNTATGASMERERLKLEAQAQREPVVMASERAKPVTEKAPVVRTAKKKKRAPESDHFTASYSHPSEKKTKKAASAVEKS